MWIGAAELDRAPQWARRNLFGHVSPMLGLIHIDGGTVDSVTMLGKRRLLVFWDHATRVEQAEAINMMQVLQGRRDHVHSPPLSVQRRSSSADERHQPAPVPAE